MVPRGGEALADWLPEANPCDASVWSGVSCTHDGGRVTALDLSHAGLALDSLQPLETLMQLQTVRLTGNAVNASLPASWAGLTQLEVADLRGTGVRGTLPPQWSTLAALRQLALGDNSLSGSLPASWAALSNLTQL